MKVIVKRVLVYIIGWAFLLLGLVGLFLPILQGVLFILIGLLILSKESKMARALLVRFQQRYPKQYRKMHEFKERLKKRFRIPAKQ